MREDLSEILVHLRAINCVLERMLSPSSARIRAIASECGMFSNDYQNSPEEFCERFARALLDAYEVPRG